MSFLGGLREFFLPRRSTLTYPQKRLLLPRQNYSTPRPVYRNDPSRYWARRTGYPQSVRLRSTAYPPTQRGELVRPLQRIRTVQAQKQPGLFDSMLSTNFSIQRPQQVQRRTGFVSGLINNQRKITMFNRLFR